MDEGKLECSQKGTVKVLEYARERVSRHVKSRHMVVCYGELATQEDHQRDNCNYLPPEC